LFFHSGAICFGDEESDGLWCGVFAKDPAGAACRVPNGEKRVGHTKTISNKHLLGEIVF
jgi:hypothetical protein